MRIQLFFNVKKIYYYNYVKYPKVLFINSDEKSLPEKKKDEIDESIIIEKTEEMIKYEKETGNLQKGKGK